MLQGDTKSRWNDEPFQMFEGGAWWIPPELPFVDEVWRKVEIDILDTKQKQYTEDPGFDTEDEQAENEKVDKGTLGKIAKQRLAVILREVTFQRGTIARAMAFAIDHSDAATEVFDISALMNTLPTLIDCEHSLQINTCTWCTIIGETSKTVSDIWYST